jgi:hypothetical protein
MSPSSRAIRARRPDVARAVAFEGPWQSSGSAIVTSANTMTLSPSAASFLHEIASLLTPAPPSPP